MNILIADDHKAIVNGYKLFFSFLNIQEEIIFFECNSCQECWIEINKAIEEEYNFDLAIVDYYMPSFLLEGLLDGSDVGLLLKKHMPKCKIFLLTSVIEDLILFGIYQKLKPEAIATKSEIDIETFSTIIEKILKNEKFVSNFIKDKLEESWNTDHLYKIQNRKILFLISNGFKIREIANELSLSEIAVKKRISNIRKSLGLNDTDSLLKEIKRRKLL